MMTVQWQWRGEKRCFMHIVNRMIKNVFYPFCIIQCWQKKRNKGNQSWAHRCNWMLSRLAIQSAFSSWVRNDSQTWCTVNEDGQFGSAQPNPVELLFPIPLLVGSPWDNSFEGTVKGQWCFCRGLVWRVWGPLERRWVEPWDGLIEAIWAISTNSNSRLYGYRAQLVPLATFTRPACPTTEPFKPELEKPKKTRRKMREIHRKTKSHQVVYIHNLNEFFDLRTLRTRVLNATVGINGSEKPMWINWRSKLYRSVT